ncbi:MAG: hypothetical protein JW963_00780 [Anaerolineales bacterium]|nr:hypothetical protein [Anaerolineales bacterium]
MGNFLKMSLFALVMIALIASFSLFPHNWSSVAAEQGAYPPPSSPSQPLDPIAYPPPENENTPIPTLHPSENEPFVSLLEIEAEIELRKSLGFRSDIEYVEAVRSSDDAVIKELFGGMVLTPIEAKELETRINLEEDGNALLNFFENDPKLQNTFGGIYLEHAAGSEDETVGGQLVLQLVRDQMAVNELQKMLPPLQYPERLYIELVDFSNHHLEQQFQVLSEAAPSHPEIQAVSLDQKNNQVNVLITPSDAKKSPDGIVDKASLPNDLAIMLADPSIVVGEGRVESTLEAVRGEIAGAIPVAGVVVPSDLL